MIRIWITLALVGALGVAGFVAWRYYTDSQARIEQLAEDRARLQTATQQLQATLDEQTRWREQQTQFLVDLNDALAEAEDPLRELQTLLSRHNLENLASERPGLIERRINDATRDVFDAIECDTGNC